MKSAVGMTGVVVFGLGSICWGWLSDCAGRRAAVLASLLLGATCQLLSSLAPSYPVYFACYILAGLCINGTYIPPFVLTVEAVGKRRAALASQLINFPFVVGELLLILLAYYFRNFRHMVRVAFAPTYLLVVALWCSVPESPRWLLVKNKYETLNS